MTTIQEYLATAGNDTANGDLRTALLAEGYVVGDKMRNCSTKIDPTLGAALRNTHHVSRGYVNRFIGFANDAQAAFESSSKRLKFGLQSFVSYTLQQLYVKKVQLVTGVEEVKHGNIQDSGWPQSQQSGLYGFKNKNNNNKNNNNKNNNNNNNKNNNNKNHNDSSEALLSKRGVHKRKYQPQPQTTSGSANK